MKVNKPGSLKSVKAIGWFIEEYGVAQISINLTNINVTPVHVAFDEKPMPVVFVLRVVNWWV